MTSNLTEHQTLALAAVLDYAAEHGHTQIPTEYTNGSGLRLGIWVKNARARHRTDGLNPAVVAALNLVPGWEWRNIRGRSEASTRRNANNLRHLDAFVAEHGHASVPQHYKCDDGHPLGQFVKGIRKGRNEGRRTPLMDAVAARPGWVWKASKKNRTVTADGTITLNGEDPFEERVRALRLFAHQHGHTCVPRAMTTATGVPLGDWVGSQRSMYRIGRLSSRHIAVLEQVPHWQWRVNAHEARWFDAFNELSAHVAATGKSLPTMRFIAPSGHHLGKWVVQQRSQYRAGQLRESFAALLETLPGWTWNNRNDTFDRQYNLLLTFATEHPGCHYPADVQRWTDRRRSEYASGSMDAERIVLLEQVPGWSWLTIRGKVPATSRKRRPSSTRRTTRAALGKPMSDRQRENIALLTAYAAEYGHTRVPRDYVTPDGVRLGLTVKNLQDRRASLHPDVVAALETLPGWTWWKVAAQATDAALAALDTFIAEHGHAAVPADEVVNGVPLGDQVRSWRVAALAGTLNTALMRELETKRGWKWTLRHASRASVTLAA
ncbi:helicase associated domain-containing protein [Curtobacterium sp. MCBD17_040]|uniref:helicase associated domain-containing protein n=1 Tax=Curtobacterium sp. MCBD17_040 TaxID=2175674 RepID=UPI000DA9CDA7|nr:helicase associated domain-containing protein [Curtobacterium sp. MCBD17_040]WIB65890.1 helicase associated domain-containing protein [Curtobacterium sp. MCBD17_040]